MTRPFIKPVPARHHDPDTHLRLLADAINQLIKTLIPNTGSERVTGATTLDNTHGTVYVDTDSAAVTITLPAGASWVRYRIINVGSSGNNVTITPDGSELLLGVNSNFILLDGDVLIIEFEPTEGWW